jgi:hypothetical protein
MPHYDPPKKKAKKVIEPPVEEKPLSPEKPKYEDPWAMADLEME